MSLALSRSSLLIDLVVFVAGLAFAAAVDCRCFEVSTYEIKFLPSLLRHQQSQADVAPAGEVAGEGAFLSSVLLPCLLPGCAGGFAPFASSSSLGRGIFCNNFFISGVKVTYNNQVPDREAAATYQDWCRSPLPRSERRYATVVRLLPSETSLVLPYSGGSTGFIVGQEECAAAICRCEVLGRSWEAAVDFPYSPCWHFCDPWWGPASEPWGPPKRCVLHAKANPPMVTRAIEARRLLILRIQHLGWHDAYSGQVFALQFNHPAFQFTCRHRSGEATFGVRVDRHPMLVLRFDIEGCGTIFLSPGKPTLNLRLKIVYPRRHRPIRQSRGAPTVLSECENEDARCFFRGHFSWASWPRLALRPRRKYHLCLQQQISSSFYLAVLCNLGILFPHWCNLL